MNISDAHWHLLFNHFPIILSITATGLLILAFFIRSKVFTQTAMFILVLAALTAIPAFQTGEMAEEMIEMYPDIDHGLIDQHAESAHTAYILILIAGGISLLALLYNRTTQVFRPVPLIITLIAALASAGYMTKVGREGGQIRHPEIDQAPLTEQIDQYREHDDD